MITIETVIVIVNDILDNNSITSISSITMVLIILIGFGEVQKALRTQETLSGQSSLVLLRVTPSMHRVGRRLLQNDLRHVPKVTCTIV